MTQRLGLAVVTYRRRDHLARLLDSLAALTVSEHELVVADDGGQDGTVELCRARGVRVVTGRNRGVAHNKNRGLYALAALGCDPLVLLEDDAHPVRHGWDLDWVQGTRRWHHLAYQHPRFAVHAVAGAGTPEDPFVNPAACGVCLSISAQAFAPVGFFDSRFQGYGHEHAEWTTRIKRAGYGYREITLADGRQAKAQLYLAGGLQPLPLGVAKSHRDKQQLDANRELQLRIAHEPVLRCPWRTPAERSAFLAEQAQAGIDGEPLAAALDACSTGARA